MKLGDASNTPFAGLKKAMKERAARQEKVQKQQAAALPPTLPSSPHATPETQPKSRKLRSEDEQAFAEAMQDVREIADFRRIPFSHGQRPHSRAQKNSARSQEQALRKQQDVQYGLSRLSRIIERSEGIVLSDTDEFIQWTRKNIHGNIASMLHNGTLSIQDYIDLHGYTRDEAAHELEAFLSEAKRRGLRCVKIIHGRGLRSPGGPVLKGETIRLLRGPLRKFVDAFSSARACDGGLGATYVLVR